MDAEPLSIDSIFIKNRFLTIPFYQRPYVWDEENWDKFYNDISLIAKCLLSNPNQPIEKYFLGSIILKKIGLQNNIQTCQVVDGQQRLTTIVIFMKALFLFLNRDDLFLQQFYQSSLTGGSVSTLRPNRNDQLTYDQVLSLTSIRRTAINDTLMAKCFAHFVKLLDEDIKVLGNDILLNLYNAIINQVLIVVILVEQNENEQKIFETINNEGTRLTTGDLLKNYLFSSSQINDYDQYWVPIFEGQNNLVYWNRDTVEGRVKVSHIDKFLYRYLLIKMQEPKIKNNLTTYESKEYRQLSGVFNKFRTLLSEQRFSLTKQEVIDDIREYSTIYKDLFSSEILDETIDSSSALKRLAYFMEAQNAWTMTPYILYICKTVGNAAEKEKIFDYLEKYLIRRLICKSSNNNYSDLFSENLIGQQNNTYATLKAYLEDANERGNLLMPSDADVLNAVKTKDNHLTAKTILYMLESKISQKFGNVKDNNDSFNSFVVESYMPEKVTMGWTSASGFTQEMRSSAYKTLGNYTLLRGKLTGKQKKDTWQGKKVTMTNLSKDVMTFDGILHNQVSWDEKCIDARNTDLGNLIIQTWSI